MKILPLLSVMLVPSVALVSCASPPAATDQTAAASAPAAPVASPAPAVRPAPREVLKRMGAYLGSLDRFKVRVEKTTELILTTDQRLHEDRTMKFAVQKPNRLRIDYQNLSGGRQLLYDGQTFVLYTPQSNVYASAPAAPTIDETLDLLEERYRISTPITDLLSADTESRLVQNLTSETYVGRILVRGVPCHHLAFQSPEVDWEIWIEDGANPLPRRLLLIDKSVEGSPQMTAYFTDWDTTPQLAADLFSFTPPPGAQKITFLERTAPAIRPASTTP